MFCQRDVFVWVPVIFIKQKSVGFAQIFLLRKGKVNGAAQSSCFFLNKVPSNAGNRAC